MPDGTNVPMWGFSCGTVVVGSGATCASLHPNSTGWSPVVITVPSGQDLEIELTNNLSFTPAGSQTPSAQIPTSLVIVGQVGGGLGGSPQRTTSPLHTNAEGCPTWFIAQSVNAGQPWLPGMPCPGLTNGASNMPPTQANRVQSFSTEVATGTTADLIWKNPRPGTYLLESGTHPSIQVPMGLIGVVVVTTAPTPATTTAAAVAGTAYPAVGTAPAVQYSAELPLLFSEIDPVQNKAVDTAVRTAGFNETRVWSGLPVDPQGNPGCGYPGSSTYQQCYPPAVNYTPFYYLINGVAFNKTMAGASVFQATAGTAGTPPTPVITGISGNVLVRMVNAGLRMHVPSIVGSLTTGFPGTGTSANGQGSTTGTVQGFSLIAEDGHAVPGVQVAGATTVPAAPRVQTDVFMAAGKTYDVMINAPTCTPVTTGGTCTPASLPVYDRELSLSGNSSERDAGMLAYISVNGGTLPTPTAGSGLFAAAVARADTYNALAPGQMLSVTDTSKGVIANDTNVYGVTLLSGPTNGTLSCGAQPQNTVPGLCANGTFIYTPTGTMTTDSFTYCANGTVTGTTCSSGITATVTLGASTLTTGVPSAISQAYTAKTSTYIKIPSPGILAGNSDPNKLPLTVALSGVNLPACTNPVSAPCGTVDSNGGFTLAIPTPTTPPTTATTASFNYKVQNSQGTQSTGSGTVTVTFPVPSNLQVTVLDAQAYNNCQGNSTCIAGVTQNQITDYRWIIEEDKTFWVDPNCTTNQSITATGCPHVVPGPVGQTTIPTFGTNFHASHMDFVAQGCTGQLSCEGGQTMLITCTAAGAPVATCPAAGPQHVPAVCDVGNGACRPDPTGNGFTAVMPSSVQLDPTKRYYISVLPGDAANPFPAYTGAPGCSTTTGAQTGNAPCGHTMGGAQVPPACNFLVAGCTPTSTASFAPVTVLVLPTPLPTGKLSVEVFEDDFPLNGEHDSGGGIDVVSPVEPGLGGFNLVLWDTYGGLGDVTGQNSYDMFNQPLSNSLAGTIDPVTKLDACPISPAITANVLGTGNNTGPAGPPTQANPNPIGAQKGIMGMIVTCPKYESDNMTLSPLAGQAVIANLMPEKFSVQAYPAADRIARGEEWLQTNTLDGQHPHDSFIRIGEPSYFQEYGPGGYHVSIGFANPAIINARHDAVCAGLYSPVGPCTNTITGQVNVERLSRTPDQRLYPSGSHDALTWTQCWVSLGDPDAEDFMFTKCDADGNFTFKNVPGGNWRLTIGDQWNDQIIDGLSTPANIGCTSMAPNGVINATTCPGNQTLALGQIGVQQWQSNIYARTFIDDNKNGIWDKGEIGIPQVYTWVRYRDGHNSNVLLTDPNGIANFNETFPLFNWYVVEADTTRYKHTGTHTVYDAGGPADGSTYCGNGTAARQCGKSIDYNYLSNTFESIPLPSDLSVPGAVYCANADCAAEAAGFAAGTPKPSFSTASTGRIDPPWVVAEGWSGLTSHANWIDFGMAPYASCPPACVTVQNAVSNPTGGGTSTSTTQVGENGGIHGKVIYASTRPFDDASQMIQQPWEPNIPNVTINLYQENFAADGVTKTLTLVDTTKTSSWDDWAQGFYPNSTAGSGTGAGQLPYMSCPGQGTATGTNADLFFFSLNDQPQYLDLYNSEHNGGTLHTIPYNSQFKCYDAMHVGNQLQPAPYDGMYQFPSVLPGVGIVVSGTNAGKEASSTTAVVGWHQLISTTGTAAGSYFPTKCTICVANPDATDKWRVGAPMLPPGKYVVEVIMPPGYEVYKEEDKNLLIGDNYIAPATVQFAGLGTDIFIIPDQASVASLYDPAVQGFNPTNYQNSTVNLGLNEEVSGVPGFPGFVDPLWPCVGEMRVVPDYLSLFPQVKETGPFAGATRPLCDRKEVTLATQMGVDNNFFLFTSTHIASKFTGVITDDFTSEFDPFAPQFGEKFAPPNMAISTRDYLGNEISRVYSDHWGTYESMIFSSWEVNPPNITGYSPNMMVQCMNDPGPILDTNPSSPTFGKMINDPLYNPAYSNFCYEEPYMPGLTTYLDTPVVPTQAFVGAGYNNADCALPDATPAISEVDGDQVGPWVSAAGNTLTITALGDQQVQNDAYSGPSATAAPFNLKTVKRHYGFGTCTVASGACTNGATVTIAGFAATITSWSDTQIVVTVPPVNTPPTSTPPNGVPACAVQQQAEYSNGASTAYCGQLVITAANGQQSVDAVTVTIGGKPPAHVAASATIQSAIDAAAPGDLIIVDPTCPGTPAPGAVDSCITDVVTTASGVTTTSNATASHTEMLLMWKPVRLQGVGAATTIINANVSPAGKLLDPWRRHVNCLFGLALNGSPFTPAGSTNVYDPTSTYSCPDAGWQHFVGSGETITNGAVTVPSNPQVDRNPSEALLGWDATLNGNLAELLQEPSLLGAYEGAGITVLGRGVNLNGADGFAASLEGEYPAGSTLLTGVVSHPELTSNVASMTNPGEGPNGELLVGDANPLCHTSSTISANPYPSNFMCNPSMIDGLSITNSSQGGGGIFLHAWAHNIQIANNRIYNNAGTLSGGISVGQGEFGPAYLAGSANAATNLPPGSCSDGTGLATNQHLPWCLQTHVAVHNNVITANSAIGDELFTATLSGGGGVSFCTGNDYYKFNYNFVCGNLSAGEGGGLVHLGEIFDGDIEHNSFVLNQSINPTIPTNGGGIMVQGTPDTDPVCPGVPDADCPSGLSDGTGPGLLINANLLQGNSADSGAGGGIRLQQVNGTDVATFPDPTQTTGFACPFINGTNGQRTACLWHDATITNNIIVNNVAGWDGAGISLQDALNVNIVNNTIAHNDSLATSGVLTQSLGTPEASSPAGSCTMNGPGGPSTVSCPQSAGVTSTPNSSLLLATYNGTSGPPITITCPPGQTPATGCRAYSNPILANDILWQNRSFQIGVGGAGPAGKGQNQQNVVTLFNAFSTSAAPNQTATGACPTAASQVTYWDLGVRGDTAIASGTFRLHPTNSLVPTGDGYNGGNTPYANNTGNTAGVVSSYCNGSRVPPECTTGDGCAGPSGFGVPPGIADAVAPNPHFSLTPFATVDEGNNWINVSWGPLTLSNPSLTGGANANYGGGAPLGNYALAASSPAIGKVMVSTFATLPPLVQMVIQHDFFGNPRPETSTDATSDIGAVEFQGTSQTATMSLSPATLAFGNVLVGTRPVLISTLTNSGAAATTVTYSTLPTGFTRATGGANCGANLGAGASCTLSITFAPTQSIAYSATLTLTFGTGTPSPLTLPLSGTGFPLFTPASLTFGYQAPGTTSAPQTVTLQNLGATDLSITAIALAGTNANQFVAPNYSSCTTTMPTTAAPFTFPAGASCTITEQYAPTVASPASALLSFTVTGGTNPYSVTLTGTGPFTVSPSSLAFGNQPDHTTSTSQPVTLTNTGANPVTITSISNLGGSTSLFPETYPTCGTLPATIAVGGSCTINVSFAPGVATGSDATAGNKSTTLTVSATGLPNQTVALTGTTTAGTAAFSAPSPLLTTGGASGTATRTGTVTVTNTATGATAGSLTLTGTPTVTKVGTTGGTFSVTGGTCVSGFVITTAGGATPSCTIIVQYLPGGSTATATAHVNITDTGATTLTQSSANFSAN
jgi:hypothetical protein